MSPPEAAASKMVEAVTSPAAGPTAAADQRPPRHRRVQFIRIENANGDAAPPAPQYQQAAPNADSTSGGAGTPLGTFPLPLAGPSPMGSTKASGGAWGARPPLHPGGTPRAGTPRVGGGITPRSCGVGHGSLPGTPRSCAGTPRCRHAHAMAVAPPAPKKPTAAQDHKYFNVIIGASFLLTINAGFINTITLNNLHAMPSAHVTGMVARASIYAAKGQGWPCAQYVVAYLFFLIGATISGMLINYETFYLGRSYGRALFIIAAVQSVALLTENVYDDSIVFIWLCCICCGLQNGLTSKYSGNAVRTTHLTGATTDLGIAIGHILKGRKGEWWKVQLHGIALVGFFIGGVLGVFAFQRYEHGALLFNVALTAMLALAHTAYVSYHERMSVMAVLESKSDIRLHKKRVPRLDDSAHPVGGAKSPSNSLHGAASPLHRTAGNFRLPSPRVLLSPNALSKGFFKRRHFPKNAEEGDEAEAPRPPADMGKQSLLHGPPSSFSSSSSVEGDDDEEEEAKDGCLDLEAGGPRGPRGPSPQLPPQPQPQQRGLPRHQSLPMFRPGQQQQPQPPLQHQQPQPPFQHQGRVLPHCRSLPPSRHPSPGLEEELYASCCSTPRSYQQFLEDEGLVPMPEDMNPLPDFEPGDEAARAAMAPSPTDEEAGLELDWYGGCSSCDCDAGVDGEGVEGEFGYSPRCCYYLGVAEAGEGEGEGEEDDDDDPPTDNELPADTEQGGAGAAAGPAAVGAAAAAAAAAPAPAAAQQQHQHGTGSNGSSLRPPQSLTTLQKPPLPPRGATHSGGGGGGAARRMGLGTGKPPLKRGTSL